jgi:hypothetical protein
MNSTIFWDITLCSLLRVSWRFGGPYRLHIQGWKISRARNQRERRWQAQLCLFFDPEDGGDMFLRNVSWLSTDYTALYLRRWYSSKTFKFINLLKSIFVCTTEIICVPQSHIKCTNGTLSTACISVTCDTRAARQPQTILTVHCCRRTRSQPASHRSSCDCSDTAPATRCSSCYSQQMSDADSRIQMPECDNILTFRWSQTQVTDRLLLRKMQTLVMWTLYIHCWMISAPALCLEGPGLKSQPRDWLFWLRTHMWFILLCSQHLHCTVSHDSMKGGKVAHVRRYFYTCPLDYAKWATLCGRLNSSWARCSNGRSLEDDRMNDEWKGFGWKQSGPNEDGICMEGLRKTTKSFC